MLKTLCLCASVALLIGSNVTLAFADTVYVALCNSNNAATINYAVPTNAIIQYVGGNSSVVKGFTASSGGLAGITMPQNLPEQKYTGLTNIQVSVSSGTLAYATFAITTPAPPAIITNCYLPANALVIPSSVTGPVNVTLQSSTDLLNWSDATPGVYGPNLGTNRFFRVKAQAQ